MAQDFDKLTADAECRLIGHWRNGARIKEDLRCHCDCCHDEVSVYDRWRDFKVTNSDLLSLQFERIRPKLEQIFQFKNFEKDFSLPKQGSGPYIWTKKKS